MSFVKTYEEILNNSNESGDFFDAEMLTLAWETKTEAIEKLLSPQLKPAAKSLVLAFIADYPSTNFGVPYKESALFVKASFEGQEGFYCLSMPVTNDMAMAGGREIWGYLKKLANIEIQREGDRLEGSTERHGIQFMKVKANLTGKINDNSATDELLSLGLNREGEYSTVALITNLHLHR